MNYYIIIILAVLFYFFIYKSKDTKDSKETFETTQQVSIRTIDNKYISVCANKSLCLSKDPMLFTVMKFSDNIIALQNENQYIAACFGNKCTDIISANSFNPYAANAKLNLIKNNDKSYIVQFYDGKYMSVSINNTIIRTINKAKAIPVFIE